MSALNDLTKAVLNDALLNDVNLSDEFNNILKSINKNISERMEIASHIIGLPTKEGMKMINLYMNMRN